MIAQRSEYGTVTTDSKPNVGASRNAVDPSPSPNAAHQHRVRSACQRCRPLRGVSSPRSSVGWKSCGRRSAAASTQSATHEGPQSVRETAAATGACPRDRTHRQHVTTPRPAAPAFTLAASMSD
eukprot:3933934-Rhodomonas_salina.2